MRSQVSRIRPRLCDTKIIDVPIYYYGGPVFAEDVVVPEGVADEVDAFRPAPDRLLFVLMTEERGDRGDTRCD